MTNFIELAWLYEIVAVKSLGHDGPNLVQ